MAHKDLRIDVTRTALAHRRTKIVATVGPASASVEVLTQLVDAGVDVFRLNFSHGTHAEHAVYLDGIREAARQVGRHVGVLADLCGPKIRTGRFRDGGIDLTPGERVTLTVRPGEGRAGVIPSEYADLAKDLTPGDRVLLDDGRLELHVLQSDGTDAACEVVHGGRLTDRKGINLPGVSVSAPALTTKDRADAAFAAEAGVDFLALSFVRRAADVAELRARLAALGHATPIVAKIEKPEALDEIGAILEAADGVMVARGDLGVEMAAEQVPLIQQELIRLSLEANRPVIVATQMLESMILSARPTRAEVTDVAAAAMAGADAVMLSGETAVGDHPVEAVRTMDRVLRMIEGYQWHQHHFADLVEHSHRATAEATSRLQLSEALARASAQLSRELSVKAVVVPAHTGHTARMVSAERPAAPIVALADSPAACRALSLSWGVHPHHVAADDLPYAEALAVDVVRELGLADEGHFLLLVTGGNLEGQAAAPAIRLLLAQA